jgi:serine/threonine protein kinase
MKVPSSPLLTLPPHTPPAVRPTFAVGHSLGRYRVDAVVGVGASSTVYRATDTALQLPVVLKVLATDASPSTVSRFRNEILFSRRVAHAGFCRIYELHEEETFDGPLRYLTMELVDGRTLGDVMNEGLLPPLRALQLARTLCDVIAAAHDDGVVHGDLKPGNIMVRTPKARRRVRDGGRDDLVVLDFGAASAKDVEDSGVRVGSLRYMAPELFEREKPSPQSDVWAIGVILYGCLTGRYPFDGQSELAVAEATRKAPSPPSAMLSSVGTPWPGSVDDVVLRALSRDRRERFADCRAFAASLDDVLCELLPRPTLWQRFKGLWR